MKIQDIIAVPKSKGVTFPQLIDSYKKVGVSSYTYQIDEGNYSFIGVDGSQCIATLDGTPATVLADVNVLNLQDALTKVQQEKIDFPQFCVYAGLSGVLLWIVDLEQMVVQYKSISGDIIVSEKIPVL